MTWLLRSVAAFLVVAAVSCQVVIDYTYPEFKVEELGESVTISAYWKNNSETDTPDGRWINPQVKLLDFNTGSHPGYSISASGWNLTISRFTRADIGYWHCIMTRRNESGGPIIKTDALQKVGLNVKGPYFEDLWQKYQRNVTIGLGAGFGFAVFATVICMAWQFRWEKRMEKKRIADASFPEESKRPAVEMNKLPEKLDDGYKPEVAPNGVTPVQELSKGQTNAAFEDEQEVKTTSFSASGPSSEPVNKPSPPPSYTEEVPATETRPASGGNTNNTTNTNNTNNNASTSADVHA